MYMVPWMFVFNKETAEETEDDPSNLQDNPTPPIITITPVAPEVAIMYPNLVGCHNYLQTLA